ncbi:hypothetical protein Tsubulata_019121 [Turnera subulata]|uniref:Uncharacterized protein n=1 Tax=Turnera subulata TaxID=218843 RepID=A0A9Q0GFJ2_9ROSI|nr:hypothetical protein Tsubulata_019121 [Turnera subulata]
MPEIKQHPWLPKDLIEMEKTNYAGSERDQPAIRIIQEAKTPGEGAKVGEQALPGASDDLDADLELEVDVSVDSAQA